MPLLAITTSAPPLPPAARAEALARLSAEVARALEKPEAYVMIAVAPPATMLFGGAPEPALYAELKNVGTLAPDRVAALSALLCGALGAAFGVAKERIYIEFTNADGALWGWNGETFAD
jgi:phenylpyruvate tautomerase PptA (4-oxalocrotonate tautomerase family)